MQKAEVRPKAGERRRGNFRGSAHIRRLGCRKDGWRLLVNTLTVVGLASLLAACGGGVATHVDSLATNTSSQPSQLTISSDNIAFGNVETGTTSTQTIILGYEGTGSVTISQVSAGGSGFSISGLFLPASLAAGQSISFSALFSPATAGSVSGGVSVVSNASNSPVTVTLSGTGVTQLLTVNPSSLSFGNVTVGSSSALPVMVTNTGSASVTLSQTATSGAGFSATGPALPLTLAAAQNTSFSVTFNPTSAGSVTGNFSVVSNASNSPTVTSLSALGANTHSVTLTWVASTSSNITGYNVYRGTVSGGPYTKVTSSLDISTTYTDTAVEAGQTYYYVTTSVSAQEGESSYSNEAVAVIPSP